MEGSVLLLTMLLKFFTIQRHANQFCAFSVQQLI